MAFPGYKPQWDTRCVTGVATLDRCSALAGSSSYCRATCWAATVLTARQLALGLGKAGHLPRATHDDFDHDNRGTGATQHFDRRSCNHNASNAPAATAAAAKLGTTTTLGDRLSAARLSTNKTPPAFPSLQLPSRRREGMRRPAR